MENRPTLSSVHALYYLNKTAQALTSSLRQSQASITQKYYINGISTATTIITIRAIYTFVSDEAENKEYKKYKNRRVTKIPFF